MTVDLSRRRFMAASTTACWIGSSLLADRAGAQENTDDAAGKPWLRKSFKASMFYGQMTMAEHFAEAKKAGFEGVEIEVPTEDVAEAIAASTETGLIIDGSVGGYGWKFRHTDSDDEVRRVALGKLKTGLKQTGELGGDSMLVVTGHGFDGTTKKVLQRAQQAIESALPVAEESNVSILVANVHNRMFYDHMGGQDQSADALAEFIDRFDSPLVGIQFDIGDVCMFGDPAEWIRTLGPRIKKLDVKDFSRQKKSFSKIGDGDIDWPSVVTALHEINYTGWIAADFGRSHISRLVEISKNMEKHLHCSQSLASVK